MTKKEQEADAKALACSNARLAKRLAKERREEREERERVRAMNDYRFGFGNDSGDDGETVATEALIVLSDDTSTAARFQHYTQLLCEYKNLISKISDVKKKIHDIEQSGVLD